MIDYDKELNPAQREAVMTLQGPVLVIAGAGSGKTRTLVYRVARLIEEGTPPQSILLLTFTRKAAQEMLERAARIADERSRAVSGGTFHSLGNRILRLYGERLGLSRDFTILDRSDMEEILRSLAHELAPPKGSGRFPQKSTLANLISKAANLQRPLETLVAAEYTQFLEHIPALKELQSSYTAYKRGHHLVDYDDLLLGLRELLRREADLRARLAEEYAYLMVDEYQDTNAIQADIVALLGAEHRNVMVVGDDSQAIYAFRGADYQNMFQFPVRFPEARLIRLEENFRSTQPVLSFANALMGRAPKRYSKCLFTRRRGGSPPRVVDVGSEPEQALYVCRAIQEGVQQGRSLTDFAVLFRASYHSFELEGELTRSKVPYVKYGGFKFLESAHIKDFLAHLRVVSNPQDAVSWIRILRLIPGVGEGRSQAIIRWMREQGAPPGEVHRWPGMRKGSEALKDLAALLRKVAALGDAPREAVAQVLAYYGPKVPERFDDAPRRQRELEQLLPMAERYRKLSSFLDDLMLEPPTSPEEMDPRYGGRALTLSTVHSAKGLEWGVVFIIWAAEGRFPQARAYEDPEALEEERRLMYVAATRAKDELIICYPGGEATASWLGNPRSGLSCFLQGLPEGVVTYESARSRAPVPAHDLRRPETLPPPAASQAMTGPFSSGDRVRHPAFGAGVVSRLVEGDKVEVLFRDYGRKLLHLAHTTLERV